MNDFTRGVLFAITLTVFGYSIYEAGKATGRREERRKKKIKEIPIVIVKKSNKEES